MLYDKRKFIKRNTKIIFTGIKISFHSQNLVYEFVERGTTLMINCRVSLRVQDSAI